MATWYVNKSGLDAGYVFTVSGISIAPTAGATYTNNGITYTVVGITTSNTFLFCTGSGVPQASGNLVKASGTGDDPITFSAYVISGANANAAKLTIQAATTASASGDTVIVGSGVYAEKINIGVKTMTYIADGIVTMDGGNVVTTPAMYSNNGSTNTTLTMQAATTGGKWIIKGYVGTYLVYSTAGSNVGLSFVFSDVDFISNGNTRGVYNDARNASGSASCIFVRCTFVGFTDYAVVFTCWVVAILNATNCTFYNNANTIYVSGTVGYLTTWYNIVSDTSYAFNNSGTASVVSSNYNQFYNITKFRNISTDYNSLALWQALGPTYDPNSQIANPNFLDKANNIFYLKSLSTMGRQLGAYQYGYARGTAYDPEGKWDVGNIADNSKWYSADGNVGKNAVTGYLELVGGTSAVVDSPVYDLGSVQLVRRINLALDQTYPTNMVDKTISDVKPNYQTLEIRASGSTFAQDAVSPSWIEVKSEALITPISGRYVQLRLTLRTDDVAA